MLTWHWDGLRRRSLRSGGASLAVAVALLLAFAPLATDAATVTSAWKAKIGSAGANGTATVQGYATGTGSIALKLAKLRASSLLPVTINKGTCTRVGTVLVKVAAIKTTRTGTAARTTSLTASQVRAIAAATSGTGTVVVRVGSGSTIKCGLFAVQSVTPVVAARITVGTMPSGVAIAPSGVWVTNFYDNTLSRIDPLTNKVVQTVPLAIADLAGPLAITYGAGSLWVTTIEYDDNFDLADGSLLRLDGVTGQQVATIPIGKGAYDVEVFAGAVWVPDSDDDQVLRIDPATNAVITTIAVPGGPLGVASGLGSLWISTGDGHLVRVDPATNQPTATIPTQDTGGYVAVSGNAVWMTNRAHTDATDGMVTRVDPTTNTVAASVAVGSDPIEIAYAGGSLWVGLYGSPTVVRLSATTNAVLTRVTVSHPVYAIAATDHAVWAVHALEAPDDVSEVPLGIVTRIAY